MLFFVGSWEDNGNQNLIKTWQIMNSQEKEVIVYTCLNFSKPVGLGNII